MSELSITDADEAREFSEAQAQIGEGWARTIAWAFRQRIPEAEGLSRREWRQKYYGHMRVPIAALENVARDLYKDGYSQREISDATGAGLGSVNRALNAVPDGTEGRQLQTSEQGVESDDSPLPVPHGTGDRIELPAGQDQADAILAEFDQQAAAAIAKQWRSALPDGPRYCKYCYGEHEFAIGDDGSLIVCGSCGAGVAPLDEAIAHGGYDAFKAYITREFERAAAGTPHIEPETPRVQLNEGDEWYTPRWLFDALGIKFDLDVCAPPDLTHTAVPAERHFTVENDGLAQPWGDSMVWCNPPYSKPEPWARRMIHHGNGLFLCHMPMNAGWCVDMWEACDGIRLFQAMEFVRPDGSLQRPGYWLQLAAFGPAATEALARLQPLGQAAANKRRVASPMWRRAA